MSVNSSPEKKNYDSHTIRYYVTIEKNYKYMQRLDEYHEVVLSRRCSTNRTVYTE